MKFVLALALLISFAGCLGSEEDSETGFEPAAVLDFDFTNCQGATAFRPAPFADADPYLPPGYQPEDASKFFSHVGIPTLANLNRALMALNVVECDATNQTERQTLLVAWILIEPPVANWLEGDEPDLNWYEWRRFADGPVLGDALESVHWWAEEGVILESPSPVPVSAEPLPSTTWSFNDFDGNPLFILNQEWLESTGGATSTSRDASGHYRNWQSSPNGTLVYDYQIDASIDLGHGACSGDRFHWLHEFMSRACFETLNGVTIGTEVAQNDIIFAAFGDANLVGQFQFEPSRFPT